MAEQTLIMVKPDVVQRGLVDQIIYRFEKKGFTLRGLKLRQYEDLSARAFFGCLVEYIISGPVVAMVWDHKGVVTTGRKMIGVTDLSESALGAIRGDFSVEIGRNVIHVGDTIENGRKEIALWFPDGFVNWESSLEPWICEYIISFAFDPEFVFV